MEVHKKPSRIIKGLFGSFFLLLNFHHSISVTHHSSLITHRFKHPTPFGTITHFSSLNIFHTICGPHTYHLVRAKLFCGPHHFLFSHFPSFTPITLPKHKPEPNFNHNNKNSNNNNSNNNNNKMRPIRRLIPPPPQPATTTTTSRYKTDTATVFVHGSRSSSTVFIHLPIQNRCEIFIHGLDWDTMPKPQSPCSRNGYFETHSCGYFETPNPNPNSSLPGHGLQLQTKKFYDEGKKKKKKTQKPEPSERRRKKRKEKGRTIETEPRRRKKEKKKETVSGVELTIQCNGSHHVCLITKMLLSYEL